MSASYLGAASEIAGPLASALTEDVRRAEEVLSKSLESDVEKVEAIGRHVGEAGGKRLRPLFVALSARATNLPFDASRVATLGAAMEMIHMATLIHDDVIDNADLRRGKPTACVLYGNTAGILTGDVLLARAMSLLAEDGDLPTIRMVSSAVVEMATGEVMEVDARGVFDLSETDYLEILRRKTATFLAACCRAGAMAAGASPDAQLALSNYGEAVGMGFQIADDVIDFRSDPGVTGKPRATDFREGCATMPLIQLRGALTADEDAFVRSKFGNGVVDADLDVIAEWMTSRRAFAKTSVAAERYAERAKSALMHLPATQERELLAKLADLMIARNT
ncbi:MAG: polyprenyl synthetase family protein [Armatimonadota bacterium]|nr:polyprenyl synthetase family protein [Armatimonadota bacterium]